MYKKIMVGIDGSEPSNKALKEAAEIAKRNGAELHVFHAIAHHYQMPVTPYPVRPGPISTHALEKAVDPGVLQKYYEDAGKAVIAQAKKILEDLKQGIEDKVTYHLELEITPEEFAINFAKKNNIDLIVVGCKGHHGRLRRSLLGTVATKIVNEAPCQVLVVR